MRCKIRRMSDFPTFLAALRPRIDAAFDRLLPAETTPPERLHRAIRYSVFAGGKRIRRPLWRPARSLDGNDARGLQHPDIPRCRLSTSIATWPH